MFSPLSIFRGKCAKIKRSTVLESLQSKHTRVKYFFEFVNDDSISIFVSVAKQCFVVVPQRWSSKKLAQHLRLWRIYPTKPAIFKSDVPIVSHDNQVRARENVSQSANCQSFIVFIVFESYILNGDQRKKVSSLAAKILKNGLLSIDNLPIVYFPRVSSLGTVCAGAVNLFHYSYYALHIHIITYCTYFTILSSNAKRCW